MRRTSVWVCVAVVMAVSLRGQAQSGSSIYPDPPWTPTGYIAAAVDVPTVGSTVSSQPWDTYAAGWAFRCYDGALPTSVEVQIIQNGTTYTVPVMLVNGLSRQDVVAALSGGPCVVPSNAGFHAYLSQGIPVTGQVVMNVVMRYEGIFASSWRVVTVQ